MNFNLENLASEVKKLIDEHKIDNQKSSFNIFKITGLDTSEVRICRLIYELLDKDGCHKQGTKFLSLFFKHVLEIPFSNEQISNFNIEIEKPIKNNRRIDLFISNNTISIPIEVKINAEDQESQLVDYYEYSKNSPIFYLTLDAHNPSDYSTKNKTSKKELLEKDYRCVSFEYHILNWLYKCLQVEGNTSSLKEILSQFIEAIETITNKGDNEMKTEIINLLKSNPEHFCAIQQITNALPSIKADKMKEVFNAIKDHYSDRYVIKDYYSEKTDGYYLPKQTLPSICIELPTKLTNGYPLDLRIVIEHYLYICISNRNYSNTDSGNDNTVKDKSHIQRYNYIMENLNPYNLSNSSESFYWWCYPLKKGTRTTSADSKDKELNFRYCCGKYEKLYDMSTGGFNSVMNELYKTLDEILGIVK